MVPGKFQRRGPGAGFFNPVYVQPGNACRGICQEAFPGGFDLGKLKDIGEQLIRTSELLPERQPIFEVSVGTGNVYRQVDILKPATRDYWDIIEVKSATQLKEEYLNDVAFQKYTFLQAGIKISNCYLALINKQYVKHGDIDPEELYEIHDITVEVDEEVKGIPKRVEEMLEVAGRPDIPGVTIGRQCDNPYTCPIKTMCWEFMPDNHVFNLYGNKDKALDLYSRGILSIEEIPEEYDLNLKQEIQRECAKTKKPRVDRGQIAAFLNKLEEPIYFFDFETFSTALPIYEGTRPFQRIPFQYSIHVLEDL